MSSEEKKIYKLNDRIAFRECTLGKEYHEFEVGDCTNYCIVEEMPTEFHICKQYGIHLHCAKHTGIELEVIKEGFSTYLKCKKCKDEIKIESFPKILQECKKMLNIERFKDAKLIRLDDWYVPELKKRIDLGKSDYWLEVDIKTDKDKDTMIVLYIGKKDSSEKTQFFIKPEKLQLSNDYKDLDPATILTKIEVTLKDRKIIQEYEEDS